MCRLVRAVVHEPSLPTDQELVQASLRDPSAFASIVRRYEPPLARYLSRLLGWKSQQIEDALQEVFLKAYVNLNDYDPVRLFSPWIYRIAHNEAISLLRKRRTESRLISGEDSLLLLERLGDPTHAQRDIDAARLEEKLRAAIAGLDGKYRDVIVLRYLEDKSYDEIADILHLPMGTVATLVSRGKQRLRKALDALDTEPSPMSRKTV
jgi:RNA polymerase sigma-70 factor, ECF subfamily